MQIRPLLLALLFLCLGSSFAHAKYFTYEQITNMPRSVEKDYYIWRFLQQRSTTKAEANKVIYQVNSLNGKLRTAYRKKTGLNVKLPKIKATGGAVNHHWRTRLKGHKNFKHGIALMQQQKPHEAKRYFQVAYDSYRKRYDKDKSLFWLYLSSQEKKYILQLQKESTKVNIYTLMAADAVHTRYPKTITEAIPTPKTEGFNITDPIAWAKVKKKIYTPGTDLEALADAHKSQECIGVYTYIKSKACNDSYFPMPYRNMLRYLSPERQALIYAIARQESRFVPASVSRSFALGLMQFMPFLIEHIAKKRGDEIDLDDIFNPYKAIDYANEHLDYLTTYLYHPLFIAYAYNGGIGYTKRLIQNPHYFREGPYEPYMSMEKIQNDEVREYGKKVLANYIIYINKLGVTTRIFPFLRSLATPSKTDKFRQ